jgi:acetoin:2,6-dichlorophenolindophenol oxidoreductase subunit beta
VREITYAEAMVEALEEIMRSDPRVQMIGPHFLGLSPRRGLLDRLRQEFPDRIFDPPIAELGFCGLAIGAAMAGVRPVVSIGTASFIFQAWAQIVNEAANARYMSGGQFSVPVIFQILHGIRGRGASQHSHSPQAMLWNTPGLEIMLPASPADVKGLLMTAAASDNPTIFVDHARLFELKGPVPAGDFRIPFGVAEVKRPGRDVTIVATSFLVSRSLAAAETLAREGIDAEVVDPRTLVPLDEAAILASVRKTGRLVVADECHRRCGVAAEIAAVVAEQGFRDLKAPIHRVATLDVPVPFNPGQEAFIEPTQAKIEAAVRAVTR